MYIIIINSNIKIIKFMWSSMQKDIKDYIKSCEICCRSKDSRHKPYWIFEPTRKF